MHTPFTMCTRETSVHYYITIMHRREKLYPRISITYRGHQRVNFYYFNVQERKVYRLLFHESDPFRVGPYVSKCGVFACYVLGCNLN